MLICTSSRREERSFSRLLITIKCVKISNLTQEHLNLLAFLSVESEIVKTIDYEDIIEKF